MAIGCNYSKYWATIFRIGCMEVNAIKVIPSLITGNCVTSFVEKCFADFRINLKIMGWFVDFEAWEVFYW